jgi:hypothetical protein
MSVKKSQQVNLSPNSKCQDVINQISILTASIKSGNATDKDFTVCKRLSNKLQKLLNNVNDIDDFYRWLGLETIEMSKYVCSKYAHKNSNDKIDI